MNNTTPQLSPAEYAMTTTESVVAPDLEPGAEAGETAEEVEIVSPDIEPPTSIGEGDEVLSGNEDNTEFVAPEFSSSSEEITESEDEELFAPQELPPQFES